MHISPSAQNLTLINSMEKLDAYIRHNSEFVMWGYRERFSLINVTLFFELIDYDVCHV